MNRFGLYSQGNESAGTEGRLARMRQDLVLRPAPGGFTVDFSAGDARLAHDVGEGIVGLFLQEKPPANGQTLPAPSGALSARLSQAQRTLDLQEGRLNEFKRRHLHEAEGGGPVPDEGNLTALNVQLADVRAEIERSVQNRDLTETLLEKQLASSRRAPAPSNAKTQALEQELAAKQAQLAGLEARYTNDYPDVVKLRNSIADLQRKLDEMRAVSPSAGPANTAAVLTGEPADITQKRTQLEQLNNVIREKTSERQRLEQEIQALTARKQSAAEIALEYDALSNNYRLAQKAYQDLLAEQKNSEATLATQAGEHQEFRVFSPPTLPQKPAFPEPLRFTLGGAACGAGFGLLAIVVGAWNDTTLRTEKDIERFLGLPTLAMIPTVLGAEEERKGGAGGSTGGEGKPGLREESALADV